MQASRETGQLAERAGFERDFGFADHSPSPRSGLETKNRAQDDAAGRRPLDPGVLLCL